MWLGQKVSVILPTYNERDSIRQVILDFEAIEYVDEIIVIDNNAAPAKLHSSRLAWYHLGLQQGDLASDYRPCETSA